MNGIKQIILSVCILYIFQYVVVILSSEKFKGITKTATSILILAVTISVITNIEFDIISDIPELSYNTEFKSNDELVIEDMNSKLSEYIYNDMLNKKFEVKKVEVFTNIDEDRCINISEIRVFLEDMSMEGAIKNYLKQTVGEAEVKLSEG